MVEGKIEVIGSFFVFGINILLSFVLEFEVLKYDVIYIIYKIVFFVFVNFFNINVF